MSPPLFLLKAVGKVALGLLGGGVVVDVLREVPDLAADAWRWWEGRHRGGRRPGARRQKGRTGGPARAAPASRGGRGRQESVVAVPPGAEWAAMALGLATGAALVLTLALHWAAGGAPHLARKEWGGTAGGEIDAVDARPTRPAGKGEVARLSRGTTPPLQSKGGNPPRDEAGPAPERPTKPEPPPVAPAELPPSPLIEPAEPVPASPPADELKLPPLRQVGPPPAGPPVQTYTAMAAWRLGAKLEGRRVRVSGRASARASFEGRLVVWFLGERGMRLIVAGLGPDAARKLTDDLIEGVGASDVPWRLTVEGVVSRVGSGTMTLSHATVLRADVASLHD